MKIEWLKWAVWLACLAAAALWDCRVQKIPNRLVLAGVALATVLAALQGSAAFWSAVAGGSAALAAGFLLWKLKVFRAGDAKLLWMTMQFAGWDRWALHLASILLAGGVCALVMMVWHRVLAARIRRLGAYLQSLLWLGRYQPYQPEADDPVRLPFAVAVLLGELAAWALEQGPLLWK